MEGGRRDDLNKVAWEDPSDAILSLPYPPAIITLVYDEDEVALGEAEFIC